MPRLSVRQLFDDRRERLGLSWAAGESGAAREFTGEMLRKPGVGLIGHLNLIHPLLAQVLGRREVDYIARLDPAVREQTAAGICRDDTVAIIVCDPIEAPPALVQCADPAATPLLTSTEPSQHVINGLRPYMQQELGEGTTLHAVTLAVAPGRNLGVLVEAAVRNHILLTRGINSTREFIARQEEALRADTAERAKLADEPPD